MFKHLNFGRQFSADFLIAVYIVSCKLLVFACHVTYIHTLIGWVVMIYRVIFRLQHSQEETWFLCQNFKE